MGQTPSSRSRNNRARLLKAVRASDLTSIHKVLAKGDLNINRVCDHRGCPLLCLAVRKGDLDMVSLLVDEGTPKMNQKEVTKKGWTVHLAPNPEQAVLTKIFLNLECPVDSASLGDEILTSVNSVGERFSKSSDSHGSTFVNDKVDLNVTDKKGLSPVHITAISGAADIAKVLIEKGADVNKPDSLEASPLHAAAAYAHEDICELLLESGAQGNACEKSGLTPLHLAVMTGGVGVVRILLHHGAWAHVPDSEGRSPVHFAAVLSAFRGLDDIVRTNRSLILNLLLLKHGGNITFQDDSKCSPMSYALIKDNLRLVRMYLDFGMRLEKEDQKRMTDKHPKALAKYERELDDDSKVPSLYRACRRTIMGTLSENGHTFTDSKLYNSVSQLELPRSVENFLKYKM